MKLGTVILRAIVQDALTNYARGFLISALKCGSVTQ